MDIGKRIKELRKEKKLTQSDLAKQLNITDRAISKWEQEISNPDLETIPKISKINHSIVYLQSLLFFHNYVLNLTKLYYDINIFFVQKSNKGEKWLIQS